MRWHGVSSGIGEYVSSVFSVSAYIGVFSAVFE